MKWGDGGTGKKGEREEGRGISERNIGETGLSRKGSVTVGQAPIFDIEGNISIRSEPKFTFNAEKTQYTCAESN